MVASLVFFRGCFACQDCARVFQVGGASRGVVLQIPVIWAKIVLALTEIMTTFSVTNKCLKSHNLLITKFVAAYMVTGGVGCSRQGISKVWDNPPPSIPRCAG